MIAYPACTPADNVELFGMTQAEAATRRGLFVCLNFSYVIYSLQ